MKSNEAFPSEYLKVGDVSGVGEKYKMGLVQMEKFVDPETQESAMKPVLSFDGVEKRLILNKTNWNRIAEIHGDDSNKWIGKEVVLRLEKIEAFGKTQDAIRVLA